MIEVETAPVALIIFNRPRLTAQLFERVRAARPRRLLVVADGPRPDRPEDAGLCEAARKIVMTVDWPCELLTNFSDQNLRCRRRISTGLDWIFGQCSEAIVLEDDCIPCASFFSFCSLMLERYRDDARIMHIGGDNWQSGTRRGTGSYYFSRYTHSWGWASWRRAWRYYDVTLSLWPRARQEHWLASILEDPPEIEYWTEIFEKTYRHEKDAWDYQWLFTCWIQNGLSIVPNENLVTNIGVGPDAMHFKESHSTIGIPTRELRECVEPAAPVRDKEADRFVFGEHIGGRQMRANRSVVSRLRKKLALRTRLHGLLRPRVP